MDDYALRINVIYVLSSLPWLLVTMAAGAVCLRRLLTRPRQGWLVGAALVLALLARFGIHNLVSLAYEFVPPTTVEPEWALSVAYTLPAAMLLAGAWGLMLYSAFGDEPGKRG